VKVRMNPDEYRKLKKIFQSAVEVPAEVRKAFLESECAGDDELRAEVERLLFSFDSEFLEGPVGEPLAGGPRSKGFVTGTDIGDYRILKILGKGGMGEVYLADDRRLERRVALKVLPSKISADEERLRRFEQEAKAASALNHPNILTIFEFGSVDETHFLAAEYVNGVTLRQRIVAGPMEITEALDIAVQVAAALDVAHRNGIIHRDIKPENIMVRDDGLVKVLDFGLAKFVSPSFEAAPSYSELPTQNQITQPGVIMGTAQYMPPEQTRGHATDARSDIWSLGCVIYEMIAGRPPFSGMTSADLVAEIVKSHPIPLSRIVDAVPERLEEIVAKTLGKDPDERYQTSKDLLLDLKRLKRRYEVEDTWETSDSNITTDFDDQLISAPNIISTRKGPKDLTEVNSAEYLYWGIKAHRWTTIGIVLFVLSLVGGTALMVRRYWREPVMAPMPFASSDFSRITNNGKSSYPAISPDGKYVAYASFSNGLARVVVRQMTSDSELELMPPTKIDYFYGIRFSNEGDYIYFVTVQDGRGSLYRVPALGGTQKKLLEDIDSNISFGPDGGELVFIRNSTEEKTSSVLIASATGTDERILSENKGYGSFHSVSWSPEQDRLMVALAEESSTSYDETKIRFATISVSTGRVSVVDNEIWTGANNINWTRDGRGIVFVARNVSTRRASVWYMSYPKAETTELTNDPDSYPAISGISENQSLTVERAINEASLWSLQLRSKKVEQLRIESPEQLGRNGIVDIDAKKLLLTKFEPEASNFWLVGKDFRNETKLTDERSHNYHPALSNDGRYIVFISNRSGKARLWRSDADGKNPIQLSKSDGGTETYPRILPDNKTILFVRDIVGAWQTALMKIGLNGEGEEVVFSEDQTAIGMHSISPSGTRLAYWTTSLADSSQPRSHLKISEIVEGDIKPALTAVSFPDFGYPLFPCAWTDNDKFICVGNKDPSNLYHLSLDGTVQKLTEFKDGTIYHPTLMLDRKNLLFNRHFSKSDIYLFKEKL